MHGIFKLKDKPRFNTFIAEGLSEIRQGLSALFFKMFKFYCKFQKFNENAANCFWFFR